MVDLMSKRQTQLKNPIYPELRQGIFVGVSDFNQVVKLKKTSGKSFYGNLDAITNDRKNFLKIMRTFEFRRVDTKVLMEPKIKNFTKLLPELSRLIKNKPNETVFIFSCYASHGMIMDGRQFILVNEFDSKRGFYKLFAAE